MLVAVLRLIGKIPLRLLHAYGVFVGWAIYGLAPGYSRRMAENVAIGGICEDNESYRKLLRAVIGHGGRALMELPAVWFRDDQAVVRLVQDCRGWDIVSSLHSSGRNIIFLSPHMGCFEIAARYVSTKFPLTVMYRPQRSRWLNDLMTSGRTQRQLRLAPTSVKGVRMVSQALRRGESVGLLPDHAPGFGQGVWAEFFGKPAFTMTLPRRLQQASGAALVMTFGERLPRGSGYRLHFEALPEAGFDETQLNRAIENLVRRFPEQYFWNYNRYKKMSRLKRGSYGSRRAIK